MTCHYIYKVFGDVWKRISKSERTSFNHKSDSLRLHGSLSSFCVPHSLFSVQMCSEKKGATRNAPQDVQPKIRKVCFPKCIRMPTTTNTLLCMTVLYVQENKTTTTTISQHNYSRTARSRTSIQLRTSLYLCSNKRKITTTRKEARWRVRASRWYWLASEDFSIRTLNTTRDHTIPSSNFRGRLEA